MTMGTRRDGSSGHGGVTAAVADGGAPTGDARAARGRVGARLADAAGLGCLLSTLLVYTAAVSPFQRYATVELFVPPTTRACLRAAFVVSLVALALVILSARARRAPAGEGAPAARAGAARPEATRRARLRAVAPLAGAVVYVAGCLGFCLLATGALPSGSAVWHGVVGCLAGAGSVLELLAWGWRLRRYDLADATVVTSGAALFAVAAGALALAVPLGLVAPLIVALAAGACAAPVAGARGLVALAAQPGEAGDAAARPAGDADARGAIPQTGAFLEVVAIPAIGLVLFAMIMAVRAGQFVEDLPAYGASQVIVATLLLLLALGPRRALVRVAYRSLIPTLAVVAIAYGNVSSIAWGGSPLDLVMVFLLYSAAAILTVSTIVGIVHAGEFSGAFVVLVAVALFTGTTLLASSLFARVAVGDVRLLIAVVTGAYAVGMIVYAFVRAGRLQADDLAGAVGAARGGASGRADEGGAGGASDDLTTRDAPATPADAVPTLAERCDAIAARYRLTNREREVLEILAQGHNAVYVGEALLISQNTARTHVHNIYRKLGISSREELLALVAAGA